ncbi:MAG: ATP-dependent DNA helicase RecG [Erysipelotrichaceae bacterium]|nr:ATP-dependent DNA helicase RecG [Erysipelotrichaceae bacterium]
MEAISKSDRINKALKQMNIHSLYGVINHFPRRYDNFEVTSREGYIDKARVALYGKIVTPLLLKNTPRVKIVSFDVETSVGLTVKIVAFNREYMGKNFSLGDYITVNGVYDRKKNQVNMIHSYKGELNDNEKYKPIYSLPSSLDNASFVRLVKKGLRELEGHIYSLVPYSYQHKYQLINKEEAINKVHFPSSKEDIRQSYRHLKYEEALLFSLKNQIIRKNNKSLSKIKKEPIDLSLCEPFLKKLPFTLTDDQKKACDEIIEDMNQSALMYRLLQGDVGTGKTLVAFICLYANYIRGDQGALLAPTEALARQHYLNAKKLFENTKVKIALLLGSTPASEKKQIYYDLIEGDIDIIIGTHALFTKSIQYSSLGLAVIDEQHRFGVNQRLALFDKGKSTDLLMMSATPIPRSLALSIYGDLDVSTLYSFPANSRNVKTVIMDNEDEKIIELVKQEVDKGKRIYIVAPLIVYDENKAYSAEQLFARYLLHFHEKVGLLHGKLSSKDKELALEKFIDGTTPILISTQVIEVGIDVKQASLMVIYDANNFGLASLHQLRGRIGRDGNDALCVLAVDKANAEVDKLEVLVESMDGFKIAEEDMKMRGPGELAGVKQSGIPEFSFLNIVNDYKIFVVAREDAKEILANPTVKGNSYIISKAEKEVEEGEGLHYLV